MALLHGLAGRLTAQNGGLRAGPGQAAVAFSRVGLHARAAATIRQLASLQRPD